MYIYVCNEYRSKLRCEQWMKKTNTAWQYYGMLPNITGLQRNTSRLEKLQWKNMKMARTTFRRICVWGRGTCLVVICLIINYLKILYLNHNIIIAIYIQFQLNYLKKFLPWKMDCEFIIAVVIRNKLLHVWLLHYSIPIHLNIMVRFNDLHHCNLVKYTFWTKNVIRSIISTKSISSWFE